MHNANHHHLLHWRSAFLSKIRSDLLNAEGGLKENAAKEFLSKCEDLQRIIYVLLQVCSGTPARASEAAVIQICNSSTACRNLYVSKGQLFSAIFYHKSRNMEDGVGKPIVRYPDAVTAGIIMVYLMMVRPLETAVVYLLNAAREEELATTGDSDGLCRDHRDFLFASRGRPVGGDRLRLWFEKETKDVGIPLQTNQYRQYHSGAVKNFVGDQVRHEMQKQNTSSILHNQAGHAEDTAHNVYGVSSLDMHKITGTELEAYLHASETWHRALGLKHGAPCRLDDNHMSSSPVSQTQAGNQSRPRPSSDTLEIVMNRLTKMEELLVNRLEKMEGSLSSTFITNNEDQAKAFRAIAQKTMDSHKRDHFHADLDSLLPSPQKKVRREGTNSSSNGGWLTHLRRFLNNARAGFRSEEQKQGIRKSPFRAREMCLLSCLQVAGSL